MHQRKGRQCCVWMLALSVCLRLSMLLGLDAQAAAFLTQAAQQEEFARFLLFLETGQAVELQVEEPEPKLWILQMELPRQLPKPREEEQKPLSVPAVSAQEISVTGACTYSYDKTALLSRPSAMDFSGEGPNILIVHTHGSEAYTPEGGLTYVAQEAYRTLDADNSVIRVGAVLAETLEAAGFSVIHDTSLNDYPNYNTSYWTALQKIEGWKSQYPDLQMVIDIHRDAVERDGQAVGLSAVAEGESCAQLMLVVGTDEGGLHHPNWQENLANALKLQAVLQAKHPGLCRQIDLRTERFNQHTTPGSLLVEVGTNGNTLPQAMRSAKLLGEGLAQMLTALRQNGGTLSSP